MLITESGLDTAEWAARLEERFNYSHEFKDTEVKLLYILQHYCQNEQLHYTLYL